MQSSVYQAQLPVRARYKETPQSAVVTDQAITGGTDPNDPFHAMVKAGTGGGEPLPVGVHRAVGGPYDAPCPGDLLCAALAACQDSTIRLVANLMGIELVDLQVRVEAVVDLRGALGIQKDVPVGFQSITCDVHLKAKDGTPPEMLEKLRVAAERSCVVRETLRTPPTVRTTFHG